MTRLAFLTIAAVFLIVGPTGAQRGPGAAPSPRPGWLPRVSSLGMDVGLAITTAERQTALARLTAIEAELLKVEAVAVPRLYESQAEFRFRERGANVTSRDQVFSFGCQIYSSAPSITLNPLEKTDAIRVDVNPYAAALADAIPMAVEEDGGEIYHELPGGEQLPGTTAVYEYQKQVPPARPEGISLTNSGKVRVLFTAGRVSPWLPVSRERYLRALIFMTEGKNQENLTRVKDFASQTPYERWMSGAAQRKQNREAAVAQMPDKAAAAKALDELEKTEREVTATLKASEEKGRELNRTMMANVNLVGDRYRAQIAAMTPAERASTAWAVGADLAAAGAPFARRLVTLNPEFYRTKGSPVEVRAILVYMETAVQPAAFINASPNGQGWRSIDRSVYEAYKKLDWAAFERMVAPPR